MSTFARYSRYYCHPPASLVGVDISRMNFEDDFLEKMEPAMQRAFDAMEVLEKGAIANPDENRMVGHYWLRASNLAPTQSITKAIDDDLAAIRDFAAKVHSGAIAPERGGKFENVLVCGIGGSALGPQLLADALGEPAHDKMRMYFFDNTDPDGLTRELNRIGSGLSKTIVLVISKSGGTPETRNGMLVAQDAYKRAGLAFGKHAVAVTGEGSKLDQFAVADKFLARFPMYDWVGGRTSLWGSVGLLPAALQGLDIDGLLHGAHGMDFVTRVRRTAENPAALLALMWHYATNGRGEKDMVVLPYADRLLLFSRYLQQLVMESLGKEKDLLGNIVHQGIAVYGNKGSTDQHAYVQQLREGVANFFAVFVDVLHKGGTTLEVEPGVTCGDYLNGFLMGTRTALHENGRESVTLTLPKVNAITLGELLALFERAVGFYASLVNINAYHQPGVEAGKKAASNVLALQAALVTAMRKSSETHTAEGWAMAIGKADEAESAFLILRHLASNDPSVKMDGRGPEARFHFAAAH